MADLTTVAGACIGHARLATSGDWRIPANNQPLRCGDIAIAHNGTVPEARALADQYDLHRQTACDSEVVGLLIARGTGSLLQRTLAAIAVLGPATPLALLVLSPTQLVAVRRGQPIFAAPGPGGWYLCSRTFDGAVPLPDATAVSCALDGTSEPECTALEDAR